MRIILASLLVLLSIQSNAQSNKSINLVSYNLRYATEKDGENAWSKRMDNVKALFKFYDIDIACTQEVLHSQLTDVLEGSSYAAVGAGRDDGKEKGEYSPIFYNKARFEKRDGGVFWLSETPDVPSKGWDARFNRVCSWVKLFDKSTKKEFLVFNTHYDHVGVKARIESAKLVKKKIQEIAPKLPVIYAGDLNVTPETEAIATVKSFLLDSKEVSLEPPFGPEGTFNGFKFNEPIKNRIDYVFVSKAVKVQKYGVLTDSKDFKYYSDHFPVFVKFNF
jgi:endonuclease/exonuclease/phosphatase family metal-dependent hydrolase